MTGIATTFLSKLTSAALLPPFAMLHRPESGDPGTVEILWGEISTVSSVDRIPMPESAHRVGPRTDVLAVVPYRQIAERGFACVDDGSPLIVMQVADQEVHRVDDLLRQLPDVPISLHGGRFDVDDDAYAELIRTVVTDEIGTGEGANFVLKRSYVADISDYTATVALSLFRRLLQHESGAYWTFLVHTGDRTFVGASPERHVSLHDGVAVMNPISGTYRYPSSGPHLDGVLDFLADRKEADELYMVVDEELKMMARICDTGGQIEGPFLKEMANLAHTEYFIKGRTSRDPREVLRETMFAPTVTGSPLQNACQVIKRHEPGGRRYYSGAIALFGRDDHGGDTLDSTILIRTADIDQNGRLAIGVGATIVRHSDPLSEVSETHAKAAALLSALGVGGRTRLSEHPSVRSALARRNEGIANFWLARETSHSESYPALSGLRVLIVDAEDTFTSMLDHQLRSIGLAVTVCHFDQSYCFDGYDLVVMGPGPGDPRRSDDPKIARLSRAIDTLLAEKRPFIAVCLSHQILSTRLGFTLVRREVPNQGIQRNIFVFDTWERVGFYNTFVAHSDDDTRVSADGVVEVCRDEGSGEVHALRGPHFASMQFHPESVLTQNGTDIIGARIAEVLGRNLAPSS